MTRIFKCTTFLTSLGLSIGLLASSPVTAGADTDSSGSTTSASSVYDGLAIGDRLKITVFEVMGLQNQAETLANSFVERTELSAEYTVQRDGSLTISFIGSIPATGKTPSQIESAIEESYLRTLGVKTKIMARLLEREPVYITGPGMKPSYVKYTPGMVTLQAIALADGLSTDWAHIDVARERERLSKSQERAKTLRARLHILLTERDEKAPAGDDIDAMVLAKEKRLRDTEKQKYLAQIETLSTSVTMAQQELSILRERLTAVETSVTQKTEYVNTIHSPYTRGLVNAATYNSVKAELNNTRERLQEVRIIIAQTERRSFELEQEKKRAIVENDIQRQNEIKELSAALTDDAVTQRSIGVILRDFGENQMRTSNNARNQVNVMILRQGASGREQINADMLSPLRPGDILQIGYGAA